MEGRVGHQVEKGCRSGDRPKVLPDVKFGTLDIKSQTVGATIAADLNQTLDYDQGLSPLGPNRLLPGPARDVLANLFFDGSESPASAVFIACLTRTTEPDGFF